mmetsp:Transcript_7927/g.17188  ORF Transcript_7927/g.17188 Transcript_7927/m.17188 type:complete len:103 (-) Transcript_7927:1568-1876(-)
MTKNRFHTHNKTPSIVSITIRSAIFCPKSASKHLTGIFIAQQGILQLIQQADVLQFWTQTAQKTTVAAAWIPSCRFDVAASDQYQYWLPYYRSFVDGYGALV